jgi:hypothetical protein
MANNMRPLGKGMFVLKDMCEIKHRPNSFGFFMPQYLRTAEAIL